MSLCLGEEGLLYIFLCFSDTSFSLYRLCSIGSLSEINTMSRFDGLLSSRGACHDMSEGLPAFQRNNFRACLILRRSRPSQVFAGQDWLSSPCSPAICNLQYFLIPEPNIVTEPFLADFPAVVIQRILCPPGCVPE